MPGTATEDIVLREQDFLRISEIVYKHCGINLHDGKKELVRSRLAKRMRGLGIYSFPDYIDYAVADQSGKEFSAMIDSISTNLTSFFRENQHFEYLKNVFLPSMMAEKRSSGRLRLRGWSAGCSSGEEPYSIAITLLDAVEGKGNWDVKILATDVSTRILERAKGGVYDAERIAPLNGQQKNRYLTPLKVDGEKRYEVNQNLRKVITFGYLNLMEPWPFKGPLDFIFCRNVMIYFDKPTQERLVNRYYDVLRSGGLLFTGHSESLTGIRHKYKYIQPTIYQKS